jgi:hypothetical protein
MIERRMLANRQEQIHSAAGIKEEMGVGTVFWEAFLVATDTHPLPQYNLRLQIRRVKFFRLHNQHRVISPRAGTSMEEDPNLLSWMLLTRTGEKHGVMI